MEYWTCTICDIQIQLQARESHLSGKRHAAATEARQERIINQAESSQEAAEKWTCKTCNIRMNVKSRDPHLAGKRHAAAVGASGEATQATKSQDDPKQWTCTICNIKMQEQNRESHLSESRHAMAAYLQQEQIQGKLQPKAYFPGPYTPIIASSSSTKAQTLPAYSAIGRIKNDTINATSMFTGVHGMQNFLVWQCTLCSCSMPLSVKQLHLASFYHVEKLLEMINITCMAIPQSQTQLSNDGFGGTEHLGYQVM